MFEDLQALRSSLSSLKESGASEPEQDIAPPIAESEEDIYLDESEEIRAAKQAIEEQARKDAIEEERKREEARQNEIQLKKQEQKAIEAQKKAELIEKEAEQKRLEAQQAEQKAREVAEKKAMAAAAEEQSKQNKSDDANGETDANNSQLQETQQAEPEKTLDETKALNDLEEVRAELLTQKKKLVKIQKDAEKKEHQRLERERKEKLKKEKKAAAEERAAAEKHRKAEERERKKQLERERKAMLKREREKAAELGAGIVKVNGVEIKTELNPEPHFLWRDFFGLKGKQERRVSDSKEQAALQEEREMKREEARAAAEMVVAHRKMKYENSFFGKKVRKIASFCDVHKKAILTVFAFLLTITVGVAGVFNYCTSYEYAYNGKTLGLVKEKDTVLRVTDLVQGALTEDKNMDVVIDAKDDISFKRVPAMGEVQNDSSEEVLKKLTYMGDVNVKAYGIYVDGRKVGAVESKDVAAEVMQDIKDKYTGDYEDSEIEEAVFIEKVDVKMSNTPLENVSSKDKMVNILCTSGEKETLHKVIAGETFADIAKLYSMSEEELLKYNENVDPKKLEVGSMIKIEQTAPVLTVKMTELVTYESVVEHEVEKRKSDEIYEGDKETKQKGKDGLNEITARITTVNGEPIEETALVTNVVKKPVKEIILIGTKERPPTVGSGKYIWPASGGYTLTSNFGARWGRMHEGIDLGCSVGTNVLAADGGTVTAAGYAGAYGYLVEIDHQNGMTTRYAHNSSLLVSVGDKVYQGQQIAESGNTGRSTGPHIHFEIRVNGAAQNPLNYLP